MTGANESPGITYAYSYDDAGNRTGVWVNDTRTLTQTFNAANQIDGFTYDAAGNLIGDGAASYDYDALGHMTLRSASKPSPEGSQLWTFSVGAGLGADAKINGKTMQSALDTLAKMTPVVGSYNVATYFTAEDASKFIAAHTGVDLNVQETTKRFHGLPHAHPTMHDAVNLSIDVASLALKNPVFATILSFVSIVSAYNAAAWEMQDAWARRHANAAK